MVPDEDPPRIFLASDEFVMSRVLALRVVARADPASLAEADVARIRDALLQAQWVDALAAWMTATGIQVDVYSDEDLWTAEDVEEETVGLQVRLSPIFEDPAPPGG